MKKFLLNASKFLLDDTKYTTIDEVAEGFSKIIQNILAPVFTVIGVVAVIYAIYLGIMYAKAEDAGKRKEIQGRLIGACIGAVIIIAGATLCFALDWSSIYNSFTAPNVSGVISALM